MSGRKKIDWWRVADLGSEILLIIVVAGALVVVFVREVLR